MQLNAADLCDRRETFDAIDLQIGFAIAGDLGQFQKVRGAGHGVALKESLAADAIRRANDRTGPAFQMADHPAAYSLEIAGEIELGDTFAVTGIRPQLLVGL